MIVERLLRYYQALDMISQLDNDAYQASNVTHILGNSYQAKAILFGYGISPHDHCSMLTMP